MKSVWAFLALGAAAVVLTGTPAQAQAPSATFIEWAVTGTATASGRDEAVICSPSAERFMIHSMGSWVFDFETPTADPGEHDAQIKVSAPQSVTALHDNNIRTDDHPVGTAKLVIASAGRGQGGVRMLRIRFTADSLRNEIGGTIKATGTIVCAVM
jgi:hypothetical protein